MKNESTKYIFARWGSCCMRFGKVPEGQKRIQQEQDNHKKRLLQDKAKGKGKGKTKAKPKANAKPKPKAKALRR
jgi:hypothetical protein